MIYYYSSLMTTELSLQNKSINIFESEGVYKSVKMCIIDKAEQRGFI